MKKSICLLILCMGLNCLGQQENFKNKSFQFQDNFTPILSKIIEYDSEKKINIEEKTEMRSGAKVEVYDFDLIKNTITFKYWNYKEANAKASFNGSNNEKLFILPLDFFKSHTKELFRAYKGVDIGIYSIPFRFRDIGNKDTFDFETSLSLQANLVFGFGSIYSDKSWIDASIGIGLTGVNLNPKNSNVTENRTSSAVTFSSGIVLKPAEYANIGFFVGVDMLGQNDLATNWIYNRKVWYGVGINIGFNRISTNKSPTKKEN